MDASKYVQYTRYYTYTSVMEVYTGYYGNTDAVMVSDLKSHKQIG